MSSAKIKEIRLENYCGYRDVIFNFQERNGDIKPISAFYGTNGTGKSTLLRAFNMLGNAKRLKGMDLETLQLSFRKMTYHEDYDPTYAGFSKSAEPMIITGKFIVDGKEKQVILNSVCGVVLNELPYKYTGHTYLINADSPMEMNKFQMSYEKSKMFLDMAHKFYGFKCRLAKPLDTITNTINNMVGEGEELTNCLYTDFIISKNRNKTQVHFKNMSDGEKKIATLLRDLCNPIYIDDIDIILIDNAEQHIYKDRHYMLYDQLLEKFPTKQILMTTHSAVLVGFKTKDRKIKGYIPKKYLYNIDKYQDNSWRKINARSKRTTA